MSMRPCHFPVNLWFNPPRPSLSPLADLHSTSPTFVLAGKLNATAAEVGIATQNILLDTGATACFVSVRWLEEHLPHRLKRLRNLPGRATTVTLADGTQQSVRGWLRLSLSLGKYQGSVQAYVTELSSYDLILGDNWMVHHRAYLDFDTRSLVIRQGNNRIVVQPQERRSQAHTTPPNNEQGDTLNLMTYKQARRAARKCATFSRIIAFL